MAEFVIKSSAFKPNGLIPAKFTCDGDDVNPLLEIREIPEITKSLALIVEDPDATWGKIWDHWILWNIDPKTQYISEDSIPFGATLGKTSFSKLRYSGPCPPEGNEPHRYVFTLYALDTILKISEGSNKETLKRAMESHVIAEATLIGLYGRK